MIYDGTTLRVPATQYQGVLAMFRWFVNRTKEEYVNIVTDHSSACMMWLLIKIPYLGMGSEVIEFAYYYGTN